MISLMMASVYIPSALSRSALTDRKNLELLVNNYDYFRVTTENLSVRTTPSTADNSNIIGRLNTGDIVKIVSTSENGDFVTVEVISSDSKINNDKKLYVSKKYLENGDGLKDATKYFMVQNLASERLRIYERMCEDNSCDHKMIFETTMAIGEQKKETRTVVGNFVITKWFKFYQDAAINYPSWYREDLPLPPAPNSSVLTWANKKYLPDGKGFARGAFGWYTAHVGPNASSQWTHGTLGWGADKDKYVQASRSLFLNMVKDPRSHGCSRVSNEAIAYIHSLLPVGTPLIKIYAIEGLKGPDRTEYQRQPENWDYVLSKRPNVGANSALEAELGLTDDEILERGTFTVDRFPNLYIYVPERFAPAWFRKISRTSQGNIYGVKEDNMHGVFIIDTGKLLDYQHPEVLDKGGYEDELYPDFMKSNDAIDDIYIEKYKGNSPSEDEESSNRF